VAAVGDVDLDRYNTLVLAGGSYDGLDAEAVAAWVGDGGRLVATGDAAEWLVENGLLDAEAVELDLDERFAERPWGDLQDAVGAQVIGGAILGVEFDPTHPLAYGYDGVVPVFRQDEHAYRGTGGPGTVVARYLDDPVLSGYASPLRREQLGGTAAILAQRRGRGHVMALLDQPTFRGFWLGTDRLLANALFFGGAF
jgi:hypothetical protein